MGKVVKWVLGGLGILVGLGLIAAVVFWEDIQEIRGVLRYAQTFEEKRIHDNFRSLHKQYPSQTMRRSAETFELTAQKRGLPASYEWGGRTKSIAEWIRWTGTTGLIVIKDGKIGFERYYMGNKPSSRTISMSVAKSVVSALVGIAVADGMIQSIDDPVDKYAPLLKDGGYGGVSLKNVLQMSSGVRFNEDYDDLKSDVVRLVAAFTSGSVNDFVATLPNEREPGTYNRYVSADTQVLAMVLQAATGKRLAEYGAEKLWARMGSEFDAYWLTDTTGTEMAFAGLNAALRDYARFGLLYLNQGRNYKGEQLVPAAWVKASVTPDAPHLMPGKNNPASGSPMGYGYQWWIPENPEGDFAAIGIYGQFIYIHPVHKVVIAKSSVYLDYNNTGDVMELESLAAFRAIAAGI